MKKVIIAVISVVIVVFIFAFSNKSVDFIGTLNRDGGSEKASATFTYRRYKEWIGFENVKAVNGTLEIRVSGGEPVRQQEINSNFFAAPEFQWASHYIYDGKLNEFVTFTFCVDYDMKNCVLLDDGDNIVFSTSDEEFLNHVTEIMIK